jgi:hypothetical protein
MPIDIRQLYCKSGRPIRGLENVMLANRLGMQSLDFRALDELKRMAKNGEITPKDVFRYKGNGSPTNPGRLAQYLFDLPSGREIRQYNARATWLVINRLRSDSGML